MFLVKCQLTVRTEALVKYTSVTLSVRYTSEYTDRDRHFSNYKVVKVVHGNQSFNYCNQSDTLPSILPVSPEM